jgi:nifR3 family TIM-barrel protein
MAGYTDYPFRHVALKCGYGLTFTELVSAKGLIYGGRANEELVFCGNDINKTAVQIFGSDPISMRQACECELLKDFKIVDINMGCPVPKVFKNGDGSALLTDIHKAESVIKECVKSGKIITVKIRTGLKQGDDIASEYAKMAEQSGASLITVHGRVREAYYSGEPDYNAIYKAKKSIGIPLIANGGIWTESDADKMLENTGADGVMLARGAIADPFLVCTLTKINPPLSLKEFILEHISQIEKYYAPRRAVLEFRKFISYYLKGVIGVKDAKMAIYATEDFNVVRQIINQIL